MWCDLEPGHLGQGRDLTHLAHALRQQRIRLEDVVAAAVDQELELVEAVVVLPARDGQCIELVAKAPQAVVIVSRQRFLEPANVHPLELASYLQGLRKTPRAVS